MLPWFGFAYSREELIPSQLEKYPRKVRGSLTVMSIDVVGIDESSDENGKVSISINGENVLIIGRLEWDLRRLSLMDGDFKIN